MDYVAKFQGEYRWLSNFYRCRIVYNGIEYPSTEHAYQAAKCADPIDAEKIAHMPSPSEAKRHGSRVRITPGWDTHRITVMRDVLRIKFADPYLRNKLLATGDAILTEGNSWGDAFWGVDESSGKGLNWLGRLLMDVRDELA